MFFGRENWSEQEIKETLKKKQQQQKKAVSSATPCGIMKSRFGSSLAKSGHFWKKSSLKNKQYTMCLIFTGELYNIQLVQNELSWL